MAFDFKSEEDVKDYLENISIEYRFGCFSEKNPNSCHLLGDFLESVKKDFEKAGRLFRSNCDDYKFGQSCYKSGNYMYLGRGCKENRLEAYRYYEKGCEYGSHDACMNAGLLRVSKTPTGTGQQRDVKVGINYLNKSCEGNNAYACYFLSGIFISGDDNMEKDMTQAFRYSQKACELGNMYACANLSQMYRKGDGIEKNEKLADHYKAVAIEMQNQIKKDPELKFQIGSD